MTHAELPGPAPTEPSAGETGTSPEELGHLVKGIDFREVIAYAKQLDIPGYEEFDNMVGSHEITIDGQKATVGWVANRTFESDFQRQYETPQISVTNPGGEDVMLIEGSLGARIMTKGGGRRDIDRVTGHGERPGLLRFNGGELISLRIPLAQEGPSWYVCFYPETQEPVDLVDPKHRGGWRTS